MPGPNDYHIDQKDPESLMPGLGKDELSESARLQLTKTSAAAAAKLREELEGEREKLTERERQLEDQAREQAKREGELERRERALAKREAAAGKVADDAPDGGKTGDSESESSDISKL